MLDTLTWEMFEPLLDQKFKVTTPEGATYDFELVDVQQLPTPRRRSRRAVEPKRTPFSLFFTGETLLPQAMYHFQHDQFGPDAMQIFIVPIGEVSGGGYEYEAVFT